MDLVLIVLILLLVLGGAGAITMEVRKSVAESAVYCSSFSSYGF